MSKAKINKRPSANASNLFEVESIMNFKEMPLEVAIKMLKASEIFVSEEEASEILSLLHTLAKITIKEFLLNND
ncbi:MULTISPECIES: hypothetical protein [Chryseobacterium]|uniref:Uncharacterized protein n=2 Tax=Chryseobacterium TaxID=59732 RepID=A0A3D9B832_9FLAO|nr:MULTISPECIES: hypothetical protein [Chryseobacterium]REC49282.1 hypothetical protein DRF68_10345 [Candidatus Chryseobacterium massiliae]